MLRAAPAGFPDCWRCPYRTARQPEVCLACFNDSVAPGVGPACPVCDQEQPAPAVAVGGCGNDWCRRADRWFSVVWAIGAHSDAWRWVIGAYKYRRQTSWAGILGRILVGYLDEHMPWFDEFDVVVPMPAFHGPGGRRRWDPVGRVVAEGAAVAGRRWEFCSDLVVKDEETPALAGLDQWARRRHTEVELRRALRVPRPDLVAGRRILVVDDVFTEGSTLREVARALCLAGADGVAGLVLARQPWHRGPPPRCARGVPTEART